jgi:murein DD-endopeptidase MepM/ murein hydrolase activator NlpD
VTDWAARAQVQRTGRRLLLIVAAVAAVIMLLCLGFSPVAFNSLVGDAGQEAAFGANCGPAELSVEGIADIKGLKARESGHAAVIVAVGQQMKVPPRGWVIALATALQESKLKMYANSNPRYPMVRAQSLALPHDAVGTDHDSVGLFQQRPSPPAGGGGWGTVPELMNPAISAKKFYEALIKKVPGWERMRLTEAAQRVQRSAFPGAYQKWEPLATALVNQLADGAAAGIAASVGGPVRCALPGEVSGAGWSVPAAGVAGSGFRTSDRPTHDGVDIIAKRGTPIRAAAAGFVATAICESGSGTCDQDGGSNVSGCGWYVKVQHMAGVYTLYCHMVQRPEVAEGARVQAGQLLGYVGSSGNSSGPHLHFEVHYGGDAHDPIQFMAARGAPLGGKQ